MLTVICGNGGDYEWERDKFLWRTWIEQNVTLTGFDIGTDMLCAADQASIIFDDPAFEIIFKLKAPMWISFRDVDLTEVSETK